MNEILFHYEKVNPTTWVYLSSLLMIGLYFKFGRFWSVRNLDIVLLLLLAPGLLIAQFGGEARMQATLLAKAEAEKLANGVILSSPAAGAVAEPDAELDYLSVTVDLSAGEELPGDIDLSGEQGELLDDAEVLDEPVESLPAPTLDEEPAESTTGDEVSSDPVLAAQRRAELQELLKRSANTERLGFLWLFAVGGLFLIRLLIDPTMVRRPLLEPNLTADGLTFIGVSLFIFLMANVWTSARVQTTPVDVAEIKALAEGRSDTEASGGLVRRGPGYAVLNLFPSIPTNPMVSGSEPQAEEQTTYAILAKVIAILCHLAVILGIVGIGYWHFGSIKTGVGVATLYLMLPYAAQMTGHLDHVVPAALLIWAILCYRRPLPAGVFIGLATSLVYYPLFLLPLWVSFYWRRGLARFSVGVLATLVAMAISLVFIPETSYWSNLQQMLGLWLPVQQGLEGIWALGWNPVYRIPVLAAFVAMSGTLAIWPAQKNLGTLLSCSAAVMVATQFWHGFGGGLYLGWYLPLALLTIFRPNLEDRVALAVLGEGWIPHRNTALGRSIAA